MIMMVLMMIAAILHLKINSIAQSLAVVFAFPLKSGTATTKNSRKATKVVLVQVKVKKEKVVVDMNHGRKNVVPKEVFVGCIS